MKILYFLVNVVFQQLLFRLSEGGIGIRSPDIAAKTAYTASVVDSMYGLSKTFPSILDYADENEVETFHGFIEDLAVYNEDEQELLRIKRVEALSKSDLIQAVFDQVKHINDNAVMTLIEPSETYENHEISENFMKFSSMTEITYIRIGINVNISYFSNI